MEEGLIGLNNDVGSDIALKKVFFKVKKTNYFRIYINSSFRII